MSDSDKPDIRSARRAQREAERAARAQRKADAARERALVAARAGGLFEGMEAMPRTATADARADTADAGEDTSDARAASADGRADTAAAPTAAGEPSGAGRISLAKAKPSREPIDPARRRKLTAALAAASAVLVVVAGLASWQYVEARDATAAEQLVADAPRAATDAAREIATQMFTYDHRTVDGDLAAVRERLTDPALTEFVEQSMPTVASAAKQQEASVYATVAAAAPQEVVDSDHVTVLIMLNRMVSTKEAPEAASSASRLSLSMVQVDGTWKLGELTAL
ncbi:hypothetical protein [Rhodococcus sp. IEGM 1408]|uniref:hypothetical protein n=1 Tax=Rhodococcus sp. IEGM 1408 TaxID=3082220 RepID=UPI002953A6DF|nr:hypothetical protein [Rhodococcus sp. IEGM 1408]MDV8002452.1 hypothetical protein [Rhodococcus sp. IEGM 1408]